MKICTKCKQNKKETEFSIRSNIKKTYQPWCKQCLSSHNRKLYREKPNRRTQVEAAKIKYKKRNEEFIFKYLSNHPCVKCNQTNILTLEFDHLSDKDFNISDKAMHATLKTLEKEISKCQVLCANCHKIKTAHGCNNWKLKYI